MSKVNMCRIEEVERLKQIEQDKETIDNLIKGIDTSYFNNGHISFNIDTKDFKYEHKENQSLNFSKQLMIKYLNEQKELYEEESKEILNKLIEGTK